MADIIKELNEKFRHNVESDGKERVTAAKQKKLDEIKRLDLYKQWKKEKKEVSFPVNFCDVTTGDVIYYDEFDIPFIVTEKEIRKVYPEYEKHFSYILLNITFKGVIKKVDDNGFVYVQLNASLREDISKAALEIGDKKTRKRLDEKKLLENSLCRRIGNGNTSKTDTDNASKTGVRRRMVPVVRGTITKVTLDSIYVNLYDTGVVGVISRKYYRKNYTRDLRNYAKEGQIVKAQVLRFENGAEGKLFILSTVPYVENPWKTVKEKGLKKGDLINVRVIEKPEEKTFFWCVSDAVPGLEIMSDYTKSFGRNSVHVEDYFTCFIDKIDFEKRFFRVVPIKRINPNQKSVQVVDAD